MKKPTVESLFDLLRVSIDNYSDEFVRTLANSIHDGYNPTLKPLQELHKDEKACRRIAEMFCVEFGRIILEEDAVVHISGKFDSVKVIGELGNENAKIIIWPDGDVFFEIGGKDEPIANPFAIADKIRELGYEPES